MSRGRLCLLLAVAATGLGGLPAPGAAGAASTTSSSNWAGYAVRRPGVRFRRVSATWVQPAVTCASPEPTYSATWVGLGGYDEASAALEQVGTEADCSPGGRASYSTWYELVPAAAHTAKLKIRPGDTVSASVVVNGHRVRLRIADVTRGTLLVKRLRASAVDTSSAEWIVEAPAVCAGIQASDANCRATALANFGTTRVSRARATTTRGHTGTISDAAWSATAISLVPEFGDPRFDRAASIGQATPEDLSAAGDAFSVVYAASE